MAHRASDLEQARVHVLLDNPHARRGVKGVQVVLVRFMLPLDDFIERTRRLATELLAIVTDRRDELEGQLIEVAKADLDAAYTHATPLG